MSISIKFHTQSSVSFVPAVTVNVVDRDRISLDQVSSFFWNYGKIFAQIVNF